MQDKTSKRVRRTREQLKAAITELLKNQPFDRITVKGICDKAGVNRSTFYVHYSCPRDLIDEMEKDILDHLPVVSRGDDADDIIASLTLLLEYIKKNSAVVDVLMNDGVDSSFGELLLRSVMDKYEGFMHFENGDAYVQSYIFCITGAIGLVRSWISGNFQYPADELSAAIIRMAFRVMGSEA